MLLILTSRTKTFPLLSPHILPPCAARSRTPFLFPAQVRPQVGPAHNWGASRRKACHISRKQRALAHIVSAREQRREALETEAKASMSR